MIKPVPFHYLFCVNRLCHVSIFQQAEETRVPLTSQNRDKIFICKHCDQQLLPAFSNAPKTIVTGGDIYIPNE